jgi:hypothetical protein
VSGHLTAGPATGGRDGGAGCADRSDVDLVVVTFADDPARLAAYRDHLGVDARLVADPDRSLYGSLGAGRGRWRRVWSLGTLRLYARLLRRGRRLQRADQDTRQLGADVVVGRDGRIDRLWLPAGPDDRPPVEALLAAVDSALG